MDWKGRKTEDGGTTPRKDGKKRLYICHSGKVSDSTGRELRVRSKRPPRTPDQAPQKAWGIPRKTR